MSVRSPAAAGGTLSWKRAALFALAAVIVALPPVGGDLAWARFALASILVAAAVLSHENGHALGAGALLAVIALKDGLPLVPGTFVGWFHMVLAGSLAAAAVWAWRRRRALRLRLSPLEWALGSLPLAGLWSLPTSLAPGQTAMSVGRLLMLWAAALVVSQSLRERAHVRAALSAFAAASTLLAFLALLQWAIPGLEVGIAGGQPGAAAIRGRPAGFYFDPNFLAAHLTLAAMASLWLAGTSRRAAWTWAGGALVMLTAVAVTLSRSAWVASVVWVAATMVLASRRTRVITAATVMAAMILGAVAIGPAAAVSRAESVFRPAASVTRVLMGEASLTMIADRPVAGTGLGAFDRAYPGYLLPGADPDVTHPHQVPIALVAEMGIGGLIALMSLMIAGGLAARHAGRRGAGYGGAAIAGVLALGAGSFFQYFLYFEVGWLFVGLLAACARIEREASTAPMTAGA